MWEDLSLKEKAQVMQMAVASGMTKMNDIKDFYNSAIGPTEHRFDEGGSTSTTITNSRSNDYWNKGATIYNTLVGGGVDPVAAIGMVGNMHTESRFNAGAKNNINGGHWGLIQNDKTITNHIIKYYGDNSYNSQMRFMIDGMTTGIRGAKAAPWLQKRFDDYRAHVSKTKDPGLAAKYFHDDYEKSNNELISDRIFGANAMSAYLRGEDMSKYKFSYNPSAYGSVSGSSRSSSSYDMPSAEPITLNGKPTQTSAWINYIANQNKPITFNTPIGPTAQQNGMKRSSFRPTDFSGLQESQEMAAITDPTAAKQIVEYGLGLENNALWNSPYLLFDNSNDYLV